LDLGAIAQKIRQIRLTRPFLNGNLDLSCTFAGDELG
jgi:hypothetical protein